MCGTAWKTRLICQKNFKCHNLFVKKEKLRFFRILIWSEFKKMQKWFFPWNHWHFKFFRPWYPVFQVLPHILVCFQTFRAHRAVIMNFFQLDFSSWTFLLGAAIFFRGSQSDRNLKKMVKNRENKQNLHKLNCFDSQSISSIWILAHKETSFNSWFFDVSFRAHKHIFLEKQFQIQKHTQVIGILITWSEFE
jgi:hypothetical protein